jgi:hypothetical protein
MLPKAFRANYDRLNFENLPPFYATGGMFHAHPMGTPTGAKALRQGIDLVFRKDYHFTPTTVITILDKSSKNT